MAPQGLACVCKCLQHAFTGICVLFCVKNRYLLTFAGQEFFKGLFPPDAFLQGWPENRRRKVRFSLDQAQIHNACKVNSEI